jgi:hypothetical protein
MVTPGPPEGGPAPGEPVNNTPWVVGAIIAIATLAALLSFIGWQANKDDDVITPGLVDVSATPTPTPPPVPAAPEVPGQGAEAPDAAVVESPAPVEPAPVQPAPVEEPAVEQAPAEQPPAELPPPEVPAPGTPPEEGVTDPDAPTLGSGVGGTQGHSEPGTPAEMAGQSDPGDPGDPGEAG